MLCCEGTRVEVLTSDSLCLGLEGYREGTQAVICDPKAHEGSFCHVGCLSKLDFNRENNTDPCLNSEGLTFCCLLLVDLAPTAIEGSPVHARCFGRL